MTSAIKLEDARPRALRAVCPVCDHRNIDGAAWLEWGCDSCGANRGDATPEAPVNLPFELTIVNDGSRASGLWLHVLQLLHGTENEPCIDVTVALRSKGERLAFEVTTVSTEVSPDMATRAVQAKVGGYFRLTGSVSR